MDQIRIEELEVFARHGVFPEENTLGQKFLVNARLYTDVREAAETDDIHKSIHYGQVCQFITDFMHEHTYKLIETVADNLAVEILKLNDRVRRVELEVKKPWAPIGLSVESVSVYVEREWHTAYLSIGSNMGDRHQYLEDAIRAINDLDDCKIVGQSEYMETKPYGKTDQPDFLNAALKVSTLLSPMDLLDRIHEIEAKAGRTREIHWGPRTLDIDIVFYDSEIISDVELIVPHIDMHNRMFVVKPMCQIAPGYEHPVLGKTMAMLYEELKDKEQE